MSFLDSLNQMQRQAVITTKGPLLILAGAGSGKTNVLTHRIAYLINENNVHPSNILAFTFTNKAAKEMKERIEKKVGTGWQSIWIGTFHAICMRILRRDIQRIGYEKNFVVFDSTDQKSLITECIKKLNINSEKFQPKSVLAEISKAKDNMMNPKMFLKAYKEDYRLEIIGQIYEVYQKELFKNNALDFDDIILNTIILLSSNEDILRYYQDKFQYIHVDEYQDTNNAQYTLISLLTNENQNLCVVGDDDQSIYGWRGANIKNILNFEKEFKNCEVVKLEQNYRSTSVILDAANTVINNNSTRKSKKLWTDNKSGDKIVEFHGQNQYKEAEFVAREIKDLSTKANIKLSDIAILYRTNAQSRVFENAFVAEGIPYKMIGGLKFYDRKEIKDLTSYLRLISNSQDNVSLKRIINVPRRGIGNTTISKIQQLADDNETSLFYIVKNASNYPELKKASQKLEGFANIILELKDINLTLSLSDFIEAVLDKSGLLTSLEEDTKNDNIARKENLKEFKSVAKEFEFQNPEITLDEFLENLTLSSDTDEMDESLDSVLLLTLHSAKGLEFPVVFMVGVEEGVFPSYRSMYEESKVEEERRLCYVGITRAMQKLYISHVHSRTLYGNTTYNRPSRFIEEIPEDFLDTIDETSTQEDAFDNFQNIFNHAKVSQAPFKINNQSTKQPKTSENKPLANNPSFKTGDRVKHKKFGVGTILTAKPENNDLKLDIFFESNGKKSLMANFSNLELL